SRRARPRAPRHTQPGDPRGARRPGGVRRDGGASVARALRLRDPRSGRCAAHERSARAGPVHHRGDAALLRGGWPRGGARSARPHGTRSVRCSIRGPIGREAGVMEGGWIWWAPLCAATLHIVEEFVYPGGFAEWDRAYRPAFRESITPRLHVVVNALLLF